MTRFFWSAMDRLVFGSGNTLQVFRIVFLKTFHEVNSKAAGSIGTRAVGFLPPPPSRVAKNVVVGRPEVLTEVLSLVALSDRLMVLGL